ncbi:MAG: nucleotide exchange factor GrpE [Phycisphaerae bacterium]|nr:nucleotide exchange factor GrpE [Phycisphaerae bacterium]
MKHHKKHDDPEQNEQPSQEPSTTPPAMEDPMQAPAPQEVSREWEALQKERNDLFARLQRLSADYANYQKRVSRQIADAVAYEREGLFRTLLPVCDNFELTIRKGNSVENTDVVLAGVKIVYDQMLDVLRAHGVEPIQALNKPFDPALHEALMQRCDPEKGDSLVVEECQRGYLLAGKVLRPSKVIVNKVPAQCPQAGPAPSEQPEAPPDGTPPLNQEEHCEE